MDWILLQPCDHTKLMNYIIGMCKKNKEWITVLSDLGYGVQIIEQKINTSSGDVIKPDIIAVSDKLVHSLVFECKGGKTIDADQLKRYSTMTLDDLLRWITIFDRSDLQFDVCISDFFENHYHIKTINQMFPMLTFSSENLTKTRDFKVNKLNAVLKEPISLKNKIPTLSYYPFSEDDPDAYIAIHVIRALLSIAMKNIKGGPDVFEESVISCDEIIAHQFNYVWKALSQEHKGRLKQKIHEIILRILAKEGIKETLGIIRQRQGYKIRQNLEQFKKNADKLIEELRTQSPLEPFLSKT